MATSAKKSAAAAKPVAKKAAPKAAAKPAAKKTVAKIISLKATKTKIVVTENAIIQIAVAQQIIVLLHYHFGLKQK